MLPLGVVKILFDISEMKVGCPILQAAMGGDLHVSNHFPAEKWLIEPTENLKLYEITPEQFKKLKEKVR